MSWREQQDAYLAAGIGPDDAERDEKPVTFITINVVKPELCTDGQYHECRTFRVFPLFMAKAAGRWMAYWERKHGKGNVWEEID
jgi:hypothetical protein